MKHPGIANRKRLFSLLLVLVMLCGMLSAAGAAAEPTAIPAPDAEITLTVSDRGEPAKAADGSLMVNRIVLVRDLDQDGVLTVDEALRAAHEAYLTADGYAASDDYGYGLSVTKLWGVETMNTLFFVGGTGLTTGVSDAVEAGEALTASVNADDIHYADWYAFFTESSLAAKTGEEVTLRLKGHLGMAYTEEDLTDSALAGLTVRTTDGTVLGVSDENGSVTAAFPAAGSYVVTASGTVSAMTDTDWDGVKDTRLDCPIIAPVCVVTVTGGSEAPYLSGLTVSLSAGGDTLLTFDPAVREYHLDVPKTTEYLYVAATLSDAAPEESRLIARYPIFGSFMTSSFLSSGTEGSVWFFDPIGANETVVTVNAGPNEEQSYAIVLTPVKEGFLEKLELRTAEDGEDLLAGFDSETFSYLTDVSAAADTLYITAALAERAPAGCRLMLGDVEVKTDGGTTVHMLGSALGADALTLNFTVETQTYSIRIRPVPVHASPDDAFSGSGTEEDPYLISDAEELGELKLFVNSGTADFAEKYVKLTADVTLPEGWNPIGCTKDGTVQLQNGKNLSVFSGTFDGDGHTVTVPAGGLPLFGYVKNTTIKNLKIYGERIEGCGLVNNFEGVGLGGMAVTIDNVTLLSGTKTLKSGLIGGNITVNSNAACSIGFNATVTNCTIEAGCVIGYTGGESAIGSVAGRMQGSITNCVSYAEVHGENYVGGIMGSRDNAMDPVTVENCLFGGSVQGAEYVGGIVGSGYHNNTTAPNAYRVGINGNTVTGSVTGEKAVGGILGGDPYVAQTWNGYGIRGNCFTGTISGSEKVGAVIGFYRSLNKWDDISGNTYAADCGTEAGIGAVEFVDTSAENPAEIEGVTYFNTANGTDGLPAVQGCGWKADHNRTDDPLGADASALCRMLTEPAAPAEITLTVSVRGSLAAAADGSLMVNRPVTVADLDSDGVLTVHEALLAAHEAHLAADGYAASDLGFGLSVTKLWGVETMNTLFFVNGSGLAVGVGTDAVKAGDRILASVNADDIHYSDWYAFFTESSLEAETGEDVTLRLKGHSGMAYTEEEPADVALAGLTVGTTDGTVLGVSDENGSVTAAFSAAGSYVVTASGTVSAMTDTDWDGVKDTRLDCPIIAPVCVVTVTEKQVTPPAPPAPAGITVTFTLLGDSLHDSDIDGVVHTRSTNSLTEWLGRESYELDEGASVYDLLQAVEARHGQVSFNHIPSQYGVYIESVSFGSLTIGEFDNSPYSGWMYTVNGTHPDVGVDVKTLKNGDAVVFHYTDDYTKEEGSERWNDDPTDPTDPAEPAGPAAPGVPDGGSLPADGDAGTENGLKKVTMSAEPGKVPVIVNADGSETVVKKSVVNGNSVEALIPGGATVRLADAKAAFDDVRPAAWFAEAVEFTAVRGLFRGVSENEFAPKRGMTRAMLVTVLYRLEDEPEVEASAVFADVKSGSWYDAAVSWTVENGIVEGMGDGSFGTNTPVTREQIAVFLFRYAKYLKADTTVSSDLKAFPDGAEVSVWAKEAMEWSVGAGLFRGDTAGKLNPRDSATRAEVAALMMRMISLIVK